MDILPRTRPARIILSCSYFQDQYCLKRCSTGASMVKPCHVG